MQALKRVLIALLALVVVALVAGSLFVRQVARKALPDYNQAITLEGLREGVTVYRDQHAIPHIYAKNEHDLYMAVGYVMAQDRLWQMDLLRRVTMGRLSEIFGEDMVGADQLLRALRIPEKSERVLARTDPAARNAMVAFSLGVNQFIEKNRKKLPPEFTILGYKPEPWLPIHSANLVGYMAWDLSGSWNTEIVLHKLREVLDDEKFRQLLPNPAHHQTFVYPAYDAATSGLLTAPLCPPDAGMPVATADQPATAGRDAFSGSHETPISDQMFALLDHANALREMGLEVFSGSNSWVVSGNRTRSGKPLFANDMHLGFMAPGIWMQMQQVVEGQFRVSGVALPGQPMIIVGHNDHIAWGMTNLYVDEMDFYLETTAADKQDQYLFNGVWTDMEVRREQIAVKGADTAERINRFTHRGPVISSFRSVEGQAISMRWTGNEYSDEIRSIYLLNRASNWDEFRDALTTFIAISQNITYADVHGHIGMQTAGGVPIRKEGNGMMVAPGHTDQYDWLGLVPFEELPYEFNPEQGMVSAANNRTIGDTYPHLIGHWFDTPNRINRIREMLADIKKPDHYDFKRMMTDVHSPLARRATGDIVEIVDGAGDLTENEQAAAERLRNWDYTYTTESVAASIFERFYLAFIRHVMADETGDALFRELSSILIRNMFDHVWSDRESSWVNNINTPQMETFEEVVTQSFTESVQWLEENLGSRADDWHWGRLHQLTIKHTMGSVDMLDRVFGLNKGPYPIGGSFHTVGNNSYSFHQPFDVVHGASQRHIFNLADWSDNHVRIPTGTSGIPASNYYLDQTEAFVRGDYYQKAWEKEEVVAQARYTTLLVPTW